MMTSEGHQAKVMKSNERAVHPRAHAPRPPRRANRSDRWEGRSNPLPWAHPCALSAQPTTLPSATLTDEACMSEGLQVILVIRHQLH
jgi:hypothetical protein